MTKKTQFWSRKPGWQVEGSADSGRRTISCFIATATERKRRLTDVPRLRDSLSDLLGPGDPSRPETPADLDSMVSTLTGAINGASRKAWPLTRIRGNKKPQWWSDVLNAIRKKCRTQFNKAKLTGTPSDWCAYKYDLRKYKKELRRTQRLSWREFCGRIGEITEVSRLRRVLASDPAVPSYLMAAGGSWTNSALESPGLLLDTHFPEGHEEHAPNGYFGESCAGAVITEGRILWAIRGFDPFKSGGPDGIVPAELQCAAEVILPWLKIIYECCIDLTYIPKTLNVAKLVFIPKAGRSSHSCPMDLKPISLTSIKDI
ncbi:uncharacterized protein LOC129608088 [Condylostylus longicornis]|uniref:uncharacterized protein LOC129608088 n=1 Tax=Condylostylus longicornis TaxID=2530218 RepID=UPI00244E304B|nr:uncharacterized protein LOC129608088 [Condylostylus longicornis]